jgi:hypothetical protein
MDSLLGAPVVDIRPISDAGKTAGYVAKYIGKSPVRFDRCKRYWSSRDYDSLSASERNSLRARPGYWLLGEQAYSQVLARWTLAGHWVVEDDEDNAHYDEGANKWALVAKLMRFHRGLDGH